MINNSSIIMSHFLEPELLYNYSNLFIKNLFICGGVFVTSSFLAVFITSRMLLNNLENEYKLIYGYDSDEEDFFNSKYLKESASFSPQNNNLIIFPSNLPHSVPVNNSKQIRKALGINTLPVKTIGNKRSLNELDYSRFI